MGIEEPISSSKSNQDQLLLILQEKLHDFGLTKNESKIYLFLSENGPSKAIKITEAEKIPRTETYHLLSTLEKKGIVKPSIQRPTRFSAVVIEQAIEAIIENQQKKIEDLKLLKHDMVKLWNSYQKIRTNKTSDMLKFKSKMKEYTDSSKYSSSFKKSLEELREKSETFDN
ncbi:MAG: TrmB family transcriptional regulator [Nitrosopumilaceae archaeon]